MISPQTSSYTDFESAIAFPPRSRFLGCRLGSGKAAQTGSLFDEHLEPTGYQLTPPIRKDPRAIRVDRTEGAKGKLQKRSVALRRQPKACDPDAQPQVERTRQLEVPIGRPLGHRGQDGAALAPPLHEEASEARLERQPRRLGTKHRMTPPGPRVLGESVEDGAIGSLDDGVERNVDRRPRRVHARPASLDAGSEAEESGYPARRQGIEPPSIDLLQRDGVQVVTSLATPFPAGDKPDVREG